MKFLILMCVVVIISFASASAEDRKITSSLNPDCINCDSTVVYIKASGKNDIVHQVWDFSRGVPTVIFFIAEPDSSLKFQWNGSIPNALILSETPKYSVALSLNAIIEYDDKDDTAQFDASYPHRFIHLDKFYWERTAALIGHDNEAMVLMHHTMINVHKQRATLEFRLETSSNPTSSELLPHLLFTPNASIADITLSNMFTSHDYKNSRFALHFVMACTDNSSDTLRYVVDKTLDDEHAPGVFQMILLKTPESYKTHSADGAYLQFRPVAYREYTRDIASSTGVRVSPFNSTRIPHDSSMALFYSNSSMFPDNKMLVQNVIISFGEPGDGFYKKFELTAWEWSLGLGAPPAERVSSLVLTVLVLGLALPALLVLGGLCAVLLRRRRCRGPLLLAGQ